MEEIKRIRRELAYQGKILKVYKDYMSMPNGNSAVWDFVEHKGAAAVVAVTSEKKILMVRQYRNALDRFTLEIPAGCVNGENEPKEICALRELEEETGFKAEHTEWLININTTVAFCSELIGIYVATDLTPGKVHLDENEFVEIEEYELDDLLDMIFTGKITDGKTVAALLAYSIKYRADR